MNKRSLRLGLLYALLVILFKLYLVLSGEALSRFGFLYSGISAVFLILPFYVLLLKQIRDKDLGGMISGREAFRHCLGLFVVAVVCISVYHYIEFSLYGQSLAEQYYNSEQFLEYLKSRKSIKPEDYQQIIRDQIENAGSSAFKATTAKLFSYLLIGISGAFVVSVFMKRAAPKTS